MRATTSLRHQVDEAEQTVALAKDYLKEAEAKLAEARKALLEDVLLKKPDAPAPVGFARAVQGSLSRGGLADRPQVWCMPCRAVPGGLHETSDPGCTHHQPHLDT